MNDLVNDLATSMQAVGEAVERVLAENLPPIMAVLEALQTFIVTSPESQRLYAHRQARRAAGCWQRNRWYRGDTAAAISRAALIGRFIERATHTHDYLINQSKGRRR